MGVGRGKREEEEEGERGHRGQRVRWTGEGYRRGLNLNIFNSLPRFFDLQLNRRTQARVDGK